ncbi:hypothetical protein BCR43DRAFT_499733 [Syncephalastrum racemosum]|uniref:Arrestin C-terminal-like domain-containing protein n=1 Tax=Syncephalastrum racemosum TaxID=13706 RepID=A0A1X2GZI2_SYNRA|nr:hypothetical protein BCR43DRAFT_499733 [Syncephalastrum racemosum]
MFKKPTQQDVLRISLGHNGPVTVHNMQSDDEPGGLLRGTVVLDCPNELRIKALTLKFEGRAKVMWSEDGQYFRDERQVIHHEWHFLSSLPYNKAHRLNGKHCYHFSLPLPADLPSSLSEDRATISYHLKAVAERPAFSTNFVYKRTINVQREVLTPTLMRPVSSARTASSFSYRVQLNRHVYSPGAIVPLDVQVHTVCKVQSFVCVLKNYVTLVTARHACRFSHTLAYLRDDHFGPRQGDNASQHDIILKTEQLKIPEHLVADTQTELLRVKHKLKISFMLIRQDGTPAPCFGSDRGQNHHTYQCDTSLRTRNSTNGSAHL